jgi:hypothetical protein
VAHVLLLDLTVVLTPEMYLRSTTESDFIPSALRVNLHVLNPFSPKWSAPKLTTILIQYHHVLSRSNGPHLLQDFGAPTFVFSYPILPLYIDRTVNMTPKIFLRSTTHVLFRKFVAYTVLPLYSIQRSVYYAKCSLDQMTHVHFGTSAFG